MTSRRAKLVLLVLAVAIVGLGVLAWEPVYWWVMTKRVAWETTSPQPHARGYSTIWRWTSNKIKHGPQCLWYTTTGFKMAESDWGPEGTLRGTYWRPDGTVDIQGRHYDEVGSVVHERKRVAPWWWGVADQTEPTMPAWMKDDAKWAKALEEAR